MGISDVLEGRKVWDITQTDVLSGLRTIPDGTVQVVVTSPPY